MFVTDKMKHIRVIQLEQIKIDLSDLSTKITSLSRSFGSPSKPSPSSTVASPPLGVSPPSFSKALPPSSRFSRLAFTLKPSGHRSLKKMKGWSWGTKIDKLDQPLLGRRGSAESDLTLVGSDDDGVGEKEGGEIEEGGRGYSEEYLLGVLAPLLSTLQRLGIRLATLRSQVPEDELVSAREAFLEVCTLLSDLLTSLRPSMSISPGDTGAALPMLDPNENEMCSLMLDALSRKVKVEADKLDERHGAGSCHGVTSPMRSSNPFVVHAATPSSSTVITTISGTRRGSNSVKIGGPGPGGQGAGEVSYKEFIAGSQQSTWATHVVRLGSFQASALFTPSPIAVRRMVGGGERAIL